MALSSGGQRAVVELGGWALAASMAVASVVYYSELKAIGRDLFGLPSQLPSAHSPSAAKSDPESDRLRRLGRRVELSAGANGHFSTTVDINGRPIDVLVDSGASIIALTDDDARRAGIFVTDRDYTHQVNTANGVARVAMVTLDRVTLGSIEVRNVRAAVSEPGKLFQTLLGMSFLSRVKTRTENGRMTIEE
jgi:aspartyl protease family protein